MLKLGNENIKALYLGETEITKAYLGKELVFNSIPVYIVTVIVDPADYGMVTGAGQYKEGETVTLVATPSDGKEFAKWSIDGVEVGTDGEYSFTATSDVTLTCLFRNPRVVIRYGTATNLGTARYWSSATSNEAYAIFGGGSNGNSNFATVDAYSKTLTRTAGTNLSSSISYPAATSIGGYALIGGGATVVDTYNQSLTKGTTTGLSQKKWFLAATTVGNYALFGGGNDGNTTNKGVWYSTVDSYNPSLTRGTPSNLTNLSGFLAATTIGDYAIFCGGSDYSTRFSSVDAYNSSLVKSKANNLSTGTTQLAATTVGDYALFGGGYTGSATATVTAYDKNLTQSIVTSLSRARYNLSATRLDGYAIFAGGYSSSIVAVVDCYNKNLTQSSITSLSASRNNLMATNIGDYALFAGGYPTSSVVDVYTLQ